MLTVTEFDRALVAGRVELGRWNARPVRCAIEGCRRLCLPGAARFVKIDGVRRGYGCRICLEGMVPWSWVQLRSQSSGGCGSCGPGASA